MSDRGRIILAGLIILLFGAVLLGIAGLLGGLDRQPPIGGRAGHWRHDLAT